jgi:hypothetical protein
MSSKSAKLAKEIAFSKKIVAELEAPKPQEFKTIPVPAAKTMGKMDYRVLDRVDSKTIEALLEMFALK